MKSVDFFFDIPEDMPKYIANVDKSGYGLLHVSTKRLGSRKLFTWGNMDASDRWQEFLTDGAGRYIEIQAGLGKTQYGCIPMAPHSAWEWMEQYGALQVSEDILNGSHHECSMAVTEQIRKACMWENLEKKLARTKPMARRKARVILEGSGYGALAPQGKMTDHLEFSVKEDSLKAWRKFFETSKLHCPDPTRRPDEFLIDEKNLPFLKESLKKENKTNWYAHYHAGLGYYAAGRYKKAKKEFKKSLALAENPWAYHGLSCACLVLKDGNAAAEYIKAGMEMKRQDLTYLKEGCKILFLSENYQALCDFYETLDEAMRQVSKIRFYYISALHGLGRDRQAYELLEQGGGMEIEDIREGEDSVAQLWKELHLNLYGKDLPAPHIYNFKAY